MPRNVGTGIYTYPSGTPGVPGQTIFSARYNAFIDDLASTLNTALPINMGGTGATTAATALGGLGAVAKAGDTMTGNLEINKANPGIQLRKTASGQVNAINGWLNTTARWSMLIGDEVPESGSNTGSNFALYRFNDAGGQIGVSLSINRATGQTDIAGPITLGSTALSAAFPAATIKVGFNTGYAMSFRPGSDPAFPLNFANAADASVGFIQTSATTTAYATSSDARLKEDLKSFDAGNIIDDTNVYDFKWKNTDERAYGVIAQQAINVYPTAVARDEKLDLWAVDYSRYVPVILQELKALRARVAELEAKLEGNPV